jgi:hypothetical protein
VIEWYFSFIVSFMFFSFHSFFRSQGRLHMPRFLRNGTPHATRMSQTVGACMAWNVFHDTQLRASIAEQGNPHGVQQQHHVRRPYRAGSNVQNYATRHDADREREGHDQGGSQSP